MYELKTNSDIGLIYKSIYARMHACVIEKALWMICMLGA